MVGKGRNIRMTGSWSNDSYRTYLDNFLNKPGPTSDPNWVPGEVTITGLETSKVLSVYLGTCAIVQSADTLQCDVGAAY